MVAHEEYQLLGLLTYNALLVLFAGVSQPAGGTTWIGTAEEYLKPAPVHWRRPLKQAVSFGAPNQASAAQRRSNSCKNACHDHH